jgi:hypothetical protein
MNYRGRRIGDDYDGGTAHGGGGEFWWLKQRDEGDGGDLIHVGVGRARGRVTALGVSGGQRCGGSATHDGTACSMTEDRGRLMGGPVCPQQCNFLTFLNIFQIDSH